jgi:hypothetical protein
LTGTGSDGQIDGTAVPMWPYGDDFAASQ